MRQVLLTSLVLSFCAVTLTCAQDAPPMGSPAVKKPATVNSTSRQGSAPTATEVVRPERGVITKNWIFVVDNSDSTRDVFHKAVEGYKHVTQFPTDEWFFKLIVFSDSGKQRTFKTGQKDKKKDWHPASVDDFRAARRWANRRVNRGANSKGLSAMVEALKEPKTELTIVLISDGGFTTACRVSDEKRRFAGVESSIASWQAWRGRQGYGPAVIVSIGIRNSHYSAFCRACRRNYPGSRHNYALPDRWASNKGNKPSDTECQAFLRRLGTNYLGGYVVVENVVGKR